MGASALQDCYKADIKHILLRSAARDTDLKVKANLKWLGKAF